MGLLNEIEAHALCSSDRRAVADAADRAREELDEQRTRPLLQQVESYLRRVADALNDSDRVVAMNYSLADIGELVELKQRNFRVSTPPEGEDAVRFGFECAGTRPVKAVLPSEALARAREMALAESGLRCRRMAHAGQRRALLVEPHVPVTLEFRREGSGLKLRTRNLSGIEIRSYTLAAGRVDDELLEALLEVILRRGNRLPQLMGDTVPDERRLQLRKELARRERGRRAELSGAFSRAVFPVIEAFRRLVLRK